MNRIFDKKGNSLAHAMAALVLATASLVNVASANSDAIVQTVGGMSYVSGGVGKDSIDRLNSLAGDFNLKLVFALKAGDYLSNVKVGISDAAGNTILDALSEGPWFLARLPKGNYQIVATFGGKAEKRGITVGADKLKTIDFRWASD